MLSPDNHCKTSCTVKDKSKVQDRRSGKLKLAFLKNTLQNLKNSHQYTSTFDWLNYYPRGINIHTYIYAAMVASNN